MKQLEKIFYGIGEMKGCKFTQINSSNSAFMYEVESVEGNIHFEVFEAKNAPICIDFEKRIYSDTESKEVYPKSNDFGKWAWCIRDRERAINKFNSL